MILPKGFHLAVIMDGNGRWALKRHRPRYFGHFRGVRALNQMIQQCSDRGVSYLSVFAFSTENWKRPRGEVSLLMRIFSRAVRRYLDQLKKNQIRLSFVGDKKGLPESVRSLCNRVESQTQTYKGMRLIVALNYGGRWEILEAFKKMAQKIKTGQIKTCELTEEEVKAHLPSKELPFPHLIVRTGGVSRLSNFYLWQAAYSELYVTDVLWPDFNEAELEKAFAFYKKTERRFGTTSKPPPPRGGA